MLFPFGTLFQDSFGNGYGMMLGQIHGATNSSFQGDGHVPAADLPFSKAGTIKNLLVDVKNYTLNGPLLVKVYVNGADSGVGVSISSTGQISDNVNAVSIAPGDYVSIGTDPTTSTSGNYRIMGTVEFE